MVTRLTGCEVGSLRPAARPRPRTAGHRFGESGQRRSAARRSPSACSGRNCLSRPAPRTRRIRRSRAHRLIVAVEDLDAVAPNDRPVAFVEISDALGPGSDREGVGAKVILAFAIADGQRRAHSRADDQVGMVAEQDGDRERADQARQDSRDGILRRCAALDLASDEMADDLGIGLAFELAALGDQLVAERLEILDDPVVDQRDRRRRCAGGRCRRSARHALPSACARCRWCHGADARRARAPRLSSLPSARRRSSLPSWIVQMPAES